MTAGKDVTCVSWKERRRCATFNTKFAPSGFFSLFLDSSEVEAGLQLAVILLPQPPK